MVIDNVAHKIHNIKVHSFSVGDVEDPDLFASQPLWDWENSEEGQWVIERAIETPMWHRHLDHLTYGTKYAITAKLKESDLTLFLLKFKLKKLYKSE
jgi:hypothetical protein